MGKNKLKKDIHLESQPTAEDHPCLYKHSSGKVISIAPVDLGFFRQLQALPSDAKIELMCLSIDEMEAYIKGRKKGLANKAVEYFNKDWNDRECGEPVGFDLFMNELLFGLRLSRDEIIGKIKKGKLTTTQLQSIVDIFESGKEIYTA